MSLNPYALSNRPRMSAFPLANLRQDMNGLFESFLRGTEWSDMVPFESPSVDIAETDQTVEVKTDAPGYKPNEIHVEVADGRLSIRGEHVSETKRDEDGKKYLRMERRSDEFSRVVSLPCAVQEDGVRAELKDGVLSIILPKSAEARKRKIEVKVGK